MEKPKKKKVEELKVDDTITNMFKLEMTLSRAEGVAMLERVTRCLVNVTDIMRAIMLNEDGSVKKEWKFTKGPQ